MTLFICEHPLSMRRNNSLIRGSFFDDIENDLENEFFNHPLITFPSLYPYPYLSYNPVKNLEDQISKTFNSDVFKAVDFSPKINLSEDENNYYIHADLPGMNKDQVKMELSDDDRVLTISGERETIIDNSDKNSKKDSNNDSNKDSTKDENIKDKANENKEDQKKEQKKEQKEANKEENNKKYSRIECSYGKFSRSFSIPENADINNIQAKMENGVLEVTLKKMEPQKNEHKHSIQIQ
ncbi:HSP20-like chaperone [Neocallimastix lanati (nom. inval.)]|uniref:HSP20-like chaperone n=1 Tax=Neocallimastix californiae TaxID=1754190 RepID=A0A1Y2BRI4_9FUNG|nr:HSP20-like chaperone [Neocallimastix sp. JGI-2020a]ORY37361.1 HSP20-like chaperone [Neocallimastix californiae]|eukprot:ORY37361.1 HSP20-like chaperone [Neocallimastix californiae]